MDGHDNQKIKTPHTDHASATKKNLPSILGANDKKVHNFYVWNKAYARNKWFVLIIPLLAVIAVSIVYFASANSTVVAVVQAEQLPLSPNTSIINDTGASGGKVVMLSRPGATLNGSVTLNSMASSMNIIARGTKCRGSWTRMTVFIDGAKVLSNVPVNANYLKNYLAIATLSSGADHTIAVQNSSPNNCNYLYVDQFIFYSETATLPVPGVALASNPASVNSGAASTLSWNSTNASSCTASGGWNGLQATSGSVSTGPLTATTTYSISCSSTAGTATANTTVTVLAAAGLMVPSSIADDCSTDVTAAVLNWISSAPNDSNLVFGAGKCYRIEGTLEFSGKSGLNIDGNGSAFKSLNPPDDQRAFWRIYDSTGMKLKNMSIIGSYSNGGVFNSSLQHAHAVDLRGTNADLSGLTMSNLGGDCVYFGMGRGTAMTKSSGGLHDSTCTSIGRNGVSFTAAQNVLVQRVTTDKIGYDAFDVEPNLGPGWGASNITVDSSIIKSFYLSGYSIVDNGPLSDLSFTNNKFVGRGLKITSGDPSNTGLHAVKVIITGNSADSPQPPVAMNLDNIDILTVSGNTVPMAGGTMSQADNSCKANVTGNNFPGGSAEFTATNPRTNC